MSSSSVPVELEIGAAEASGALQKVEGELPQDFDNTVTELLEAPTPEPLSPRHNTP